MSKTSDITIAEALDEIKLAFENFCADADAIIQEAKDKQHGRD